MKAGDVFVAVGLNTKLDYKGGPHDPTGFPLTYPAHIEWCLSVESETDASSFSIGQYNSEPSGGYIGTHTLTSSQRLGVLLNQGTIPHFSEFEKSNLAHAAHVLTFCIAHPYSALVIFIALLYTLLRLTRLAFSFIRRIICATNSKADTRGEYELVRRKESDHHHSVSSMASS
jgi:hypothetical protein